jgi:magnesium transporter
VALMTDSTPHTARVRTVACLSGVSLERNVPSEEIHDTLRDKDNLVWVDVQDPGEAELSMLLEEFGFHPLALEDIAKGHERPKVDEYKGHLFAVVYGVQRGATVDALQLLEVDLFIGRNYVVSVHRDRLPALEEASSRWMRGGPMLKEGVGFLVYTLMDALIDTYAPVIDAIENSVEETELALFGAARSDGVQHLLKLKRTLIQLRRVLFPLREAFQIFLRPDHTYFSPGTLVYFQDVYQHILRILDGLDIERELVSSALDANLTVVSNQLNQTMRTLTVLTIAVGTMSAVFGAWGMNVGGLPIAESPWGFLAIVGGTVLLTGLMLYVGRRRGWL